MAAWYGRSLGALLQLSRCRWSVVAGGGGGGREVRRFSLRNFSSAQPATAKETSATTLLHNPSVTINFILPDGKRKEARAKLGDSLLDVVINNNLDIDGYGACEGTLACSTCHIIFKEENFKKISAKPTDEELDMLDLAYGLSDTSRLGCQILVTKEMEGWEVMVPAGFADARS